MPQFLHVLPAQGGAGPAGPLVFLYLFVALLGLCLLLLCATLLASGLATTADRLFRRTRIRLFRADLLLGFFTFVSCALLLSPWEAVDRASTTTAWALLAVLFACGSLSAGTGLVHLMRDVRGEVGQALTNLAGLVGWELPDWLTTPVPRRREVDWGVGGAFVVAGLTAVGAAWFLWTPHGGVLWLGWGALQVLLGIGTIALDGPSHLPAPPADSERVDHAVQLTVRLVDISLVGLSTLLAWLGGLLGGIGVFAATFYSSDGFGAAGFFLGAGAVLFLVTQLLRFLSWPGVRPWIERALANRLRGAEPPL